MVQHITVNQTSRSIIQNIDNVFMLLQHQLCEKKSTTYIPPSCDGVCVEVLGNASELVLRSSVVSAHG